MSIPIAEVDRIDTWVLRVGLAVPLVSILGLVLWHFASYLIGAAAKKRRAARYAPEPPSTISFPKDLTRDQGRASDAVTVLHPAASALNFEGIHLPETRLSVNDDRPAADWLDRFRALAAVGPETEIASDLEALLAEMCLELAETWVGRAQPRQAAVALRTVLKICPFTPQGQQAQDRLQQIEKLTRSRTEPEA